MMVHLFGAVSSPGCANFGLKRAADDGEFEFGEVAANFVRNNFYIDDVSCFNFFSERSNRPSAK